MSGLSVYYASRVLVSIAFALLLALTGTEIWLAAVIGLVALGFFVWAPRSGRYAVHPELGVTALRRDERTQSINDKAGRTAFIVTMLVLAALLLYTRSISSEAVSVTLVGATLVLGAVAYFVSDWLLRRAE